MCYIINRMNKKTEDTDMGNNLQVINSWGAFLYATEKKATTCWWCAKEIGLQRLGDSPTVKHPISGELMHAHCMEAAQRQAKSDDIES